MAKKLEDYEKQYGDEHEKTVGISNNLSAIRSSRGDKRGLVDHYRKALEKLKASPEHAGLKNPAVFGNMSNLALALDSDDGDCYKEAEELLRTAASGFLEIFGPEHPDTLTAQTNLAQHLTTGVKRQLVSSFSDTLENNENTPSRDSANQIGISALEIFERCYKQQVILKGYLSEDTIHNRAAAAQLLTLLEREEECIVLLNEFESNLKKIQIENGGKTVDPIKLQQAHEMVSKLKTRACRTQEALTKK
jgi:hypothetical protein